MKRLHRSTAARAGFTLAEVAVTLVIVGIGMVLVLQGLNTAKRESAQTYNRKVARELALITLGQIEAGLFWEDIDDRVTGNYGEEGYPAWSWELLVGEDNFDAADPDSGLAFDSFADLGNDDDDDGDTIGGETADPEEEEDAEQPFEKVRLTVTYPKLGEYENTLVIERWIPWVQVYGEDEEGEAADASLDGAAADGGDR